MKVYSLYFKIIKKHFLVLLIFISIFFTLTILSTLSNQTNLNFFEDAKMKVLIFNDDTSSPLIDGFIKYMTDNSIIVDITDTNDSIQDAIFFREVEYVIRIPKGFNDSFYKDNTITLEKLVVPDSYNSVYVDAMINQYFNTFYIYSQTTNLSLDEIVNFVIDDLSTETNIELYNQEFLVNSFDNVNVYFNFSAYSNMSVFILGIGIVMMVFNQLDIKKRNMASPMKNTTLNIGILIGHLGFSLIIWGIYIIGSIVLYKDNIFTVNGLLMILNLLINIMVCLSIGFLLGILSKNKNVNMSLTVAVSLGMSFLGGVFVSQSLLSDTIKNISSFTPIYWFVKANDAICEITNFTLEYLTPIFSFMGIQLGFVVAILSVGLVISKQKSLGSQA